VKKIQSIIFIAALIAGSSTILPAQDRHAKTSSARAAYGFAPEPVKHKKHRPKKARRDKVVSITREKKKTGPKKRSNWAG
jgi:hypothetical protein